MTKQAIGYTKARHELALRIVALSNRIKRNEEANQALALEHRGNEVEIQADKDLLDGYQRILEITPAEAEAAS